MKTIEPYTLIIFWVHKLRIFFKKSNFASSRFTVCLLTQLRHNTASPKIVVYISTICRTQIFYSYYALPGKLNFRGTLRYF